MALPNSGDPHRRITINRNAGQASAAAIDPRIADQSPDAQFDESAPPSPLLHSQPPKSRSPKQTKRANGENYQAKLLSQLHNACESSSDFEGLLRNIASTLCKNANSPAVWFVRTAQQQDDSTALSVEGTISLMGDEADVLWEAYDEQATSLAIAAVTQQTLVKQTTCSTSTAELHAMPLDFTGGSGCVIGVFDRPNRSGTETYPKPEFVVSHVARCIQEWSVLSKLKATQASISILNDVNQVTQSLGHSATRTETLLTFVNLLRSLTGAAQVCLATGQKSGNAKLAAISDVESFDPGSENCLAMRKLLSTAIAEKATAWYQVNTQAAQNPDALTHCKLTGAESCLCVILKIPLPHAPGEEKILGAILISGDASLFDSESKRQRIEQISVHVGRQLSIVLRSFETTREKLFSKVVSSWKKRGMKIAVGAAVVGAAILCIPWPMAITGKSEMQPVLRRFVAAPYDGVLQTAFVETGEVVQQGQILAQLDGRQLRIELSSLMAEYNSQRKQRDAALAIKDVAQSQIASLEMRRLQSEIELKNRRLENLEIISPISGVVIAGDLEKAEGAPVTTGQNLFEISPLDELLAEVAIPESDIQYVREQMPVEVKLDAFPFQIWKGKLEKISPQAEVVNSETVFVAEVRFENELGKLKPGMKGQASIVSDRYWLAWHLIRKPWEQARRMLVW